MSKYQIIWFPILRRYIQWTMDTPIDKQTHSSLIGTEVVMVFVLNILYPFKIVRKP